MIRVRLRRSHGSSPFWTPTKTPSDAYPTSPRSSRSNAEPEFADGPELKCSQPDTGRTTQGQAEGKSDSKVPDLQPLMYALGDGFQNIGQIGSMISFILLML